MLLTLEYEAGVNPLSDRADANERADVKLNKLMRDVFKVNDTIFTRRLFVSYAN